MLSVWRTITNWSNPTRSSREDLTKSLVLDLDTHQFCGVRIGESTQPLSFLGPASRWSGSLEYPQRGLMIRDEFSLGKMCFFFGHAAEPRGGTYCGDIRYRGTLLPLSSSITEGDAITLFGQPYWRDADHDETILFYEFSGCEWQVEFATDGRLKCLWIGTPLLADSQQREAYGVTRSWPPTYS